MKISTLTLRFALIFSSLLISNLTGATEIDLRFAANEANTNSSELFVDVQVRYDDAGQMFLAGQNFRFFYDSEVLTLKATETTSKLGKDFGDISFESHMKGIKADGVNQLSFDDHLGFVNFSIDLLNLRNGGLELNKKDGWVTIATLKFAIDKKNEAYSIVWGREGVTDLYATAFVEMGERVGIAGLRGLEIDFYGDLDFVPEIKEIAKISKINVGPNPASEFVNILLQEEMKSDATIVLRDMSGKQVQTHTLFEGEIETRIYFNSIAAATYLLEVIDNKGTMVYNQRLVIAK